MNLDEIKDIYEKLHNWLNEPKELITVPALDMLAISSALGHALDHIEMLNNILKDKSAQLKFLEQSINITEHFNINRAIAQCYICNFEDDYICHQFNGGCDNIELCRKIYDKQCEEIISND